MRIALTLLAVSLLAACASAADKAAEQAQQAELKAYQDADKAFLAQDYKTALAYYQPRAEKGDIAADERMAAMYHFGLGVTKDEAQARHWYEKAALDGSDPAAVDLGYDNMAPESSTPDYAQAMKWFTLAANRGYWFAYVELSIIYEHGLGVAKDHDAALQCLDQFVAKENAPGLIIHNEYSGSEENIGGFMVAVQNSLLQAAWHSPEMKKFQSGVVILSFHYQDGLASDVSVAKSSGTSAADAAAMDVLQKALLPPVPPSLSHMKSFSIGMSFVPPPAYYLAGPVYH